MMRTKLTSILSLALLLGACAPTPAPVEPALAATINRDCGPADGPAFTVSIPFGDRGKIVVSIWQAPEIRTSTTFTISDPTDATGSASLAADSDTLEPLSGTITFQNVMDDELVRGSFLLATSSGESFKGVFTAAWSDAPAFCG